MIFALIIKEFLAILKDPKSRFVLIGPPIIQLFVFGYGATFDLNHVPIAVYDEANSVESRQLIARFEASPAFSRKITLMHQQQIAKVLDNKDVLAVIHIHPQFDRDLALGKTVNIQIIIDGRDSNTALIALSYMQTILAKYNLAMAQQYHTPRPAARLQIRAWFNPDLNSQWFIVTGIIGLLTLVVTILVTALSVAREREQGTFDQLLVTPMTPFQILLGKAIPGLIIGLIEASFIIFMAVFWFNIPFIGHLSALYLGVFLFVFSVIGVGLMISSICVTQQQGLLGAFLFIVPAVILSGFATPIANMPPLVQDFTLINPLRYFLVIVRGVFLEGLPAEVLFNQYWPLALISLVTLSLAAWLFRHRIY